MKNNKGFAITTIVYSILILLSLSMFIVLEVAKNSYENEKEYMADVNEELNNFLITKEFADNFEYMEEFDYKPPTTNDSSPYHKVTIPKTGYYKIELWGASGGGTIALSGKGGYTKGNIYLEKDEILYIYIGGKGLSLANNANIGGYNGGGYSGDNGGYSYGGGGATDIRYFSTTPTTSDLLWNSELGLNSRIMVAGGGAGAATNISSVAGCGGNLIGGSSTSSNSTYNNSTYKFSGGSQTNSFAYSSAKKGSFGYAVQTNTAGWGGGGGGGYYGGGTGYGTTGSGGSSFISGIVGCNAISESSTLSNIIHTGQPNHYTGKVFVDAIMIEGTKPVPTHDGTSTMTGNTGNGHAKITYFSSEISYPKVMEEYHNINGYMYSGNYQKAYILKTGYYKIELWGASGGGTIALSGKGGYTKGNIYLEKDEILYIYIGGEGLSLANNANIGGYNGGGYSGDNGGYSYGGGGATDIRYFSTTPTTSDLLWNSELGLNSRIMVAGGGAGTSSKISSTAGCGGNLIGGSSTSSNSTYNNSTYKFSGGSQTSSFAYTSAKKGSFGYAVQTNTAAWGGGGGGGYYGGGTGYGTTGSGGSSFISGYQGCIAIAEQSTPGGTRTPRSVNGTKCTDANALSEITCSYHYSGKVFTQTEMKAGNETMPTHDGTSTMTGNIGDGFAKVTYIGTTLN